MHPVSREQNRRDHDDRREDIRRLADLPMDPRAARGDEPGLRDEEDRPRKERGSVQVHMPVRLVSPGEEIRGPESRQGEKQQRPEERGAALVRTDVGGERGHAASWYPYRSLPTSSRNFTARSESERLSICRSSRQRAWRSCW